MKPLVRPAKASDRSPAKRVLVVEDEVLVAMLIEDVVAEIGYDVVGPTRYIKDAFRLADQADLAILDINLNGEPIYPLADELRRRKVPFVFVTGYGADGIRADYLDAPIVAKPFAVEALTRALKRLAAA